MSRIASFAGTFEQSSAFLMRQSGGSIAERALAPRTAAPPEPARVDSSGPAGSLDEQLKNVDPKLADDVQALRELLVRFSPEAVEMFDKMLGSVLQYWGGGSANAPASDTVAAGGSIQERIQISFEETVSELNVQMADGTTISAQVVHRTLTASLERNLGQADPLVLDLNGNGVFDTTTPYDGHRFDILGNGQALLTATVTGGDGLLVLDRNGNGRIDSGKELFGDQNGMSNGYDELGRYDSNGDRVIDAGDIIFNRLQIFDDKNRDGQSSPDELTGLSELGIAKIVLSAQDTNEVTNGNQVVKSSEFVRNDGSTGRVGDLLLNYLV